MVFGAVTFLEFESALSGDVMSLGQLDPWVFSMARHPATVLSSRLTPPVAWRSADIVAGDGIAEVRRLKATSRLPLRSHGSLSLNRELLAAGLVDRIQVTVFPVVIGQTGSAPVFAGAPDLDLRLISHQVFDGQIAEFIYEPCRRI